MVKKIPPPRRGGSQPHKCDDNGRTHVADGRLHTHCSKCDKVVATDELGD